MEYREWDKGHGGGERDMGYWGMGCGEAEGPERISRQGGQARPLQLHDLYKLQQLYELEVVTT